MFLTEINIIGLLISAPLLKDKALKINNPCTITCFVDGMMVSMSLWFGRVFLFALCEY